MNKSSIFKIAGSLGVMALGLVSYKLLKTGNQHHKQWTAQIREIRALVSSRLTNNSVAPRL